MKIFLATNMAFTAYIFQEDYDRLTRQEVAHASQRQKGGSLFGQWTSTGNPVIHRALSFGESQGSRDEVARNLDEGFRICYIGEWLPVQTYEQNDMQAREWLRPGREGRFLVLNVSKAGIVPFLLNRQTTQQVVSGALEKLPGKNPFNRSDVFRQSQSMVNYNNPPRHGNVSEGAVAQYWRQPDPPQSQVAFTTMSQWYSGDSGTSALQMVVDKLQKIALREKVEMSRDRSSQDITLSFTDKHYSRKWEAKFPANFPIGGAVLIEYQGTATRHPKEHRIPGKENVNTVVTDMVTFIKHKTSIF